MERGARSTSSAQRSTGSTTTPARGRPHVTPLIAVWLDDALYFCTGPGEQKTRNLAGNPHCSLITGSNAYGEGLDLVIEGEAVRVTDDAKLARIADAYRAKYGSDWSFDVRDNAFSSGGNIANVFEVAPVTGHGFGKGTFSQTLLGLRPSLALERAAEAATAQERALEDEEADDRHQRRDEERRQEHAELGLRLDLRQAYRQRLLIGVGQHEQGPQEVLPGGEDREDRDDAQDRARHGQDDRPEEAEAAGAVDPRAASNISRGRLSKNRFTRMTLNALALCGSQTAQ